MSTSLATISSICDKPYRHSLSLHRRSNSDELDVFEAARYFSNINEEDKRNCMIGSSNVAHHLNTIIESDHCRVQNNKPARLSLDMPKISLLSSNNNISIISPSEFYAIDHQKIKECSKDDQSKKFKQPSSPGAKLASFLNSLFNQATRSKKKKTKLKNQDLFEEVQQNPSGGTRRKRSSSISHFGIMTRKDSVVNDCNVNLNSKLSLKLYSSGSSFKTPPPVYADTPTKCYKECVELSDNYHHHHHHNKHVISLPKGGGQHAGLKPKQTSDNKFYNNGKTDLETRNLGLSDRDLRESHWGTTDHDDGADSDSSSDLFDLPNIHESIFYSSSGLPVYESTRVERIKNINAAAPISGATTL